MSCWNLSCLVARLFAIVLLGGTMATVAARDGDPDRGFGTLGSVVLPFPGGLSVDENYVDVKVLADGKLLVSATVNTGTAAASDIGVMRLHANGAIDTSFGVAGARIVGFDRAGSDNVDVVRGMAIQPDGRIVLVGDAAGGTGGIDMAVVRLLANGSLDTSFGTGGKMTVAFDLGATPARRADQAVKAIVQADGRILLGGIAYTAAGAVMAVARLTSTGVLDGDFDGDGKRILDFGGGATDLGIAYSVLASADGQRTYAVGMAMQGGNQNFAIARLLGNGSPDATFAGDGTATFGFDIGGTLGDAATDAVELADGKILLCGASFIGGARNSDFSCVRFRANGTVDIDFPPVLIPFDLDSDGLDQAYAMRIDAQGRIVLAGLASAGSNGLDVAVARLLPGGQVDPSFGNDGRGNYDAAVGEGTNRGTSLALQTDGKIVVAGSAWIDIFGASHVQVLRLIGDTLYEDGFD